MPRLARLDAPGIIQHVIIRGIERRKIFLDDKDRHSLLDRLGDLLPTTNTGCYAWALLPNHAHFLLRSGESGLANLMRRLLTGYAVSFNRRHRRHGQLFQNRYKSIICQEDIYLKELVRYIHLNPLRAKVVPDMGSLNKYKYCGHAALTGRWKCQWQDTDYVLGYFGGKVSEARRNYLSYVLAGVNQGRRPELIGGGLIRSLGGWREIKKRNLKDVGRLKGDERILGGSDFVLSVLEEAEERLDRYYELRRLGYDLHQVEKRVCALLDLKPEDIYSKSREKDKADGRGLYCYWAVRELGYGLTDVARRLGITQPGVGYAVKRGEKMARERKFTFIE